MGFANDSILSDPRVSDYFEPIADAWGRISRILIVIDGDISIRKDNSFGISRLIAHLRAFTTGFASLTVTLATRNGSRKANCAATAEEFTYEGFRFDQREGAANDRYILDGYEQLWLFGFLPGNGPENDPNSQTLFADLVAGKDRYNPTSTAELKVLATWMNAGGGVFAAGDHHILGASMCRRIPRVRTMRRWRVGDDVPTRDGETRFDTLHPNYRVSPEPETDSLPQPVHWVPEFEVGSGIGLQHAPHPILCHPVHGPIDVLPDHMHEGRCFDPATSEWRAEHASASDNFGGYVIKHYPAARPFHPLPRAIAYGETRADIPGPQPFREPPLIVVYDGQQVRHGRVVVDSTWHHEFDLNLAGFEAAANAGSRENYEKITRYYVNIAIWLASPGWRSASVVGSIKREQFGYFGAEQFSPRMDSALLGTIAQKAFGPIIGPCWLWHLTDELLAGLGVSLEPSGPPRHPLLARPARSYFDATLLGELVKLVYGDMADTQQQIAMDGRVKAPRKIEADPLRLTQEAARRAAAAIAKGWRKDQALNEALLKQFEAAGKTTERTAKSAKGQQKIRRKK